MAIPINNGGGHFYLTTFLTIRMFSNLSFSDHTGPLKMKKKRGEHFRTPNTSLFFQDPNLCFFGLQTPTFWPDIPPAFYQAFSHDPGPQPFRPISPPTFYWDPSILSAQFHPQPVFYQIIPPWHVFPSANPFYRLPNLFSRPTTFSRDHPILFWIQMGIHVMSSCIVQSLKSINDAL